MASQAPLLSEDQLLCPICLGVFVQPVSTPCGHNFCMSCLSSYWDSSSVCVCPMCKESYSQRPQLRVNTFISGLTQSFCSLQLSPGSRSGVPCDLCTAPQQEAVQSCVECVSSLCALHLEPHLRDSGLRRHTLLPPDAAPQNRVCPEHKQLLSSYCTEDRVLLCVSCEGAHSSHRTLPLEHAHTALKSDLSSTEAQVTARIQEKIHSVCSIKESAAQREEETRLLVSQSHKVLHNLLSKVQTSHKELVQKMEEMQQKADSEVEVLTEEMELEIRELREVQTKLQQLKESEDPVFFLQNFPNLSLPLQSKAPASLRHRKELEEMKETVVICTSQLQEFLKKLDRDISLFSDENWRALRRVQKFAVDIKLDPETANPKLHLSQDLKQVWFNPKGKLDPTGDHSRRIIYFIAALADKGFSSGKFYFEVFVGQKDEWLLGVAKESVRNEIPQHRAGCGVWGLYFRVETFTNLHSPGISVYKGKVEKVGVFVDYDKGLVSWFDLNTAKCIHSITQCVFTEKLYPLLGPCDDEFPSNSGPMIIVPVG